MTKTSREKIVAEALCLLRDKGYAGTSMKDVAERVGLLKGSLYSHFPNKEALVPEVLSLMYRAMLAKIDITGEWMHDYRSVLACMVDMFTESRRCLGLQLAYGMGDAQAETLHPVRAFFNDIRALLEKILVQGMDRDLAHELAADTLAMLEGATLWLVLDNDPASLVRIQRSLLLRAEALARRVDDEKEQKLLSQLTGAWRTASLAEKIMARRLIEAENDIMTLRAALAGQVEAESCFRDFS